MLTIALPKGRIANKTLELFRELFKSNFEFENRKLILQEGDFKFLYVKNQDVPTYVQRGVADIGVSGLDVLYEREDNFVYLLDLGFGKCDIVVGMQKGKTINYNAPKIKVATKLTNITKNYFAKKAMDVDIVKLNGSIELAPLVGLSDAIVDIVETGTTMKENGLEPVEIIMNSSAHLFANNESFIIKKKEILNLKNKIKELIYGA
jgi:ATP phosphoribosyltransferase